MPRTLYRYMLRELVKLLATSALVLTAVMSVAFAIMSVSESSLGAWSLIKIMVYVLPGMLTIALPFAAALASTLVFFRMSQDNEISACAASGISYAGLLAPIVLLGLVLTGAMFGFSNYVVPRFWQLAERESTADAMRLVVSRIRRREVFTWELSNRNIVIYADAAAIDIPIEQEYGPRELRPYTRMVLRGVAVGNVRSDDNRLRNAYTAGRAVVDVFREPQTDRTYATMLLEDVTSDDPNSGALARADTIELRALEIPTPFRDRPQFMSLDRLRRLAAQPQLGSEVRRALRGLAEALARWEIHERIVGDLRSSDARAELAGPQGHTFRIESPQTKRGDEELQFIGADSQPVIVTQLISGLRTRTYQARSATLEFADSLGEAEPRMNLILNGVTLLDPSLPTGQSKGPQRVLSLLRLAEPVALSLRGLAMAELLRRAGPHDQPQIRKFLRRARRSVARLAREIDSRRHERAALAVNCCLVLLLGAVMSMWLRHQTPLAIFFWCFMPAVAAILTIFSGQKMIGWDDLSIWVGVSMVWAGNVGLLGIITGVYWKLRSN